jgi:hypothetical protein
MSPHTPQKQKAQGLPGLSEPFLEREKRFELSTPALATLWAVLWFGQVAVVPRVGREHEGTGGHPRDADSHRDFHRDEFRGRTYARRRRGRLEVHGQALISV